jgi:hypothetical protein
MTIFNLGNKRFAIGVSNKRAEYVVALKGKKIVGVRGRRPILDGRYKPTKANLAIRTALTEAVA